jgi:hypothetical protein
MSRNFASLIITHYDEKLRKDGSGRSHNREEIWKWKTVVENQLLKHQ